MENVDEDMDVEARVAEGIVEIEEEITAPIRPETSAAKIAEQIRVEEDVTVASSHANLIDGIKASNGLGLNSGRGPVSLGQKKLKEKALKDVTNKLDPKPAKLKPGWGVVKPINELGSRKIRSVNEWVTHGPKKSPAAVG